MMAEAESIFLVDGDAERFTPTEHARGPWDPGALHGGAPAALITAAFERMEPGAEVGIARLGFEFLRRAPQGEWIGLDAQTLLHSGGTGLAESVLHDEQGSVGRAFQTLVVQPR